WLRRSRPDQLRLAGRQRPQVHDHRPGLPLGVLERPKCQRSDRLRRRTADRRRPGFARLPADVGYDLAVLEVELNHRDTEKNPPFLRVFVVQLPIPLNFRTHSVIAFSVGSLSILEAPKKPTIPWVCFRI